MKNDQIQEKLPNLGRVSNFERLVYTSENFLTLTNGWILLRTSWGRKYLHMKKIARLTKSSMKKHHICRHYPLKPQTMKIWPKLQNSYRTKVLTSSFSVGPKFFLPERKKWSYMNGYILICPLSPPHGVLAVGSKGNQLETDNRLA